MCGMCCLPTTCVEESELRETDLFELLFSFERKQSDVISKMCEKQIMSLPVRNSVWYMRYVLFSNTCVLCVEESELRETDLYYYYKWVKNDMVERKSKREWKRERERERQRKRETTVYNVIAVCLRARTHAQQVFVYNLFMPSEDI